MSQVWKCPLLHAMNMVPMPEGSAALSVVEQSNLVVAYFLVPDPMKPREGRRIIVANTSTTLSDYMPKDEQFDFLEFRFLGTVTLDGGSVVRHVFLQKNVSEILAGITG